MKLMCNDKEVSIEEEINLGKYETLTLVYIILRIFGVISWPWIWVFSPLWIAGIQFILVCAYKYVLAKIKNKKKQGEK